MKTVSFGPDQPLLPEDIESFYKSFEKDGGIRVILSEKGKTVVEESRLRFEELVSNGEPVYGTTTGFGPFVRFESNSDTTKQAESLLNHLGVGFGKFAPEKIVFSTALLRLSTLAQGFSGIRPETWFAYSNILMQRDLPSIPEIGSLGASGDLIPLSFLGRIFLNNASIRTDTGTVSSEEYRKRNKIPDRILESREALAFTNGLSFSQSYAIFALVNAERVLSNLETLVGIVYALLGANKSHLRSELHEARLHPGQIVSAKNILTVALCFSDSRSSKNLQEVYSLRTAPQVIGAVRDQLKESRNMLQLEIQGVDDNPLFFREKDGASFAVHGGNFQGQHLSFLSDRINTSVVQCAILAERILDLLIDPNRNGGLPLLLSPQPGAESGVAGVQLTATALLAELRSNSGNFANYSIPTNGGNQDIVSMAGLASRKAYEQTLLASGCLASLWIALGQYDFLFSNSSSLNRNLKPEMKSKFFLPDFEPIRRDRPLWEEIRSLSDFFLEREIFPNS
ncbi:aromatic amino acid ammonia-lyase [Leptospira stimsonii]|uniref:aromatic amino acid ammonia-lyase n=1 Tax=Leptospira stimsonii TaxID=2202203 RepID=UPI001314D40E|nr:aromatic amino acid ammonia-lyase [Leptospira stimsonii]